MSFTLIHQIDLTSNTQCYISEGMIDIIPGIKFRYDKKNPCDPRKRFQIGKYHEDEFRCKAVVTPTEYNEIYDFLNSSDCVVNTDSGIGLFIVFTSNNQ